MYVDHHISSDNGLISQKLLLKSELYCPLHVTMGLAYSYLKYGAFITTSYDAIQIFKKHCESPWHQKSRFLTIFAGVELVIDAVCFFGKLYKWLVMLSEYTIVP